MTAQAGRLQKAEDELRQGVTNEVADDATTFVVLLWDWTVAEHRREALRVQYQRTIELKNRGRRAETDPLVIQYTQVKEEMELIQGQLAELLQGLAPERVGLLMQGQHLMPGMGVTLRAPEKLVAALLQLSESEAGQAAGD